MYMNFPLYNQLRGNLEYLKAEKNRLSNSSQLIMQLLRSSLKFFFFPKKKLFTIYNDFITIINF